MLSGNIKICPDWALWGLYDRFYVTTALYCVSLESCGGDVCNTIEGGGEKAYEKDTIERASERTNGQIWVNAEISAACIYLCRRTSHGLEVEVKHFMYSA